MRDFEKIEEMFIEYMEKVDTACVNYLEEHCPKYLNHKDIMQKVLENDAINNLYLGKKEVFLSKEEVKLFLKYREAEGVIRNLETIALCVQVLADKTLLDKVKEQINKNI